MVQAVQAIDGDIILRNLDGITSLNGLGSLVSTNGEILVYGCPRLASTRALTNFTSIGEWTLDNRASSKQCFTLRHSAASGRIFFGLKRKFAFDQWVSATAACKQQRVM